MKLMSKCLGGMLLCQLLGATAFAASSVPDRDGRAVCVGGPNAPSYAFYDWDDARRCFHRVQDGGRDCFRLARIGRCDVFRRRDIDAVSPRYCQCAPDVRPVGIWR